MSVLKCNDLNTPQQFAFNHLNTTQQFAFNHVIYCLPRTDLRKAVRSKALFLVMTSIDIA
jgi:hypothetical protein